MNLFTFWIMIALELTYCSGAIASVLGLEIEAYEGNLILEWSIAIALCGICALLSQIYCRVKKIDVSKIKAQMQTGIAVSFGIVSALIVAAYIVLEPWGGYFL